MRIRSPLLLLCGLLSVSSCASRAAVKIDRLYAYLTDSSQYFLLPPGGIEQPMNMAQHMTASYNGQDYSLFSWVKADETEMEMILLNELGATMGELIYREGELSLSSPVFPKSLGVEYIVADFQLCFYDPLLLSPALEACGLRLEVQGSARRIYKGKVLIIEIEKTEGLVKLVNHRRGYAYTLEGDFSGDYK